MESTAPILDTAHAADATALLGQITAAKYTFNGTTLALEQSSAEEPELSRILSKLKKLEGAGLLSLSGSGADTEITAFDIRDLQQYAGTDVIRGLESLSNLHFSFVEDEEERPAKRRAHYRGMVSWAQLARLYRLRLKHDIHIQLVERSEDEREAEEDGRTVPADINIDLDGVDMEALAEDVAAEQQRREEGADAAAALSAVTGEQWVWDGVGIALAASLESVNPELFKKLNALRDDTDGQIVDYSIQNAVAHDGTALHYGCHIMEADLGRLRQAARPACEEAARLLDQLTAVGWTNLSPRLQRPMPQDGIAENAFLTALNSLQEQKAIEWRAIPDPQRLYAPGYVEITHFDLDKLRAAVKAQEEGSEQAATPPVTLPGGGKWTDYANDPNRTTVSTAPNLPRRPYDYR